MSAALPSADGTAVDHDPVSAIPANARALRFARAGAAAILILACVLSVLASRDLSTPADEFVRITSGLAGLGLRDYRMDHATPPLVKYLVAAPVLAGGVNLALDDPAWRRVDDQAWTRAVLRAPGNDPLRMLRLARPPMLLLLVALGALVFAWARRLYGPAGALLATAVFALSPNTLAYTWFANMDFALGLAYTATLFALWRFLEQPSRGRLLTCGGALGLALGTHFASIALLIVIPCMLVAGGIHWSSFRKGKPHDHPSPRVRQAFAGLSTRTALFLFGASLAMLAVALLVVWALYAFETQPLLRNAPDLAGKRAWIAAHVPGPASFRAVVAKGAADLPVPGATFTRGVLNVLRRTGEKGTQGYWWFYLVVLGTKTPLPVLILLGWAFLRRPRRPSYHEWFLVLPAGVFLALASRSTYQSGLRNVYVILPLLAIYSGRVLCEKFPHVQQGAAPVPGPRSRVIAAALALWLALIAFRTHPHYLSYYNALVGGPMGGIRAAVGSVDLDWGQGLVGLGRVMDRQGIAEVVLASPATTDPAIYGIRARRLYSDDLKDPRRLRAGVYAVSTTYVRRLAWLKRRDPFARVGNVLWLYRVGEESGGR